LLIQHVSKLPQSTIPHTALSFNEFKPNELLVALATNGFYIYDVEHKRLSDWSKAHPEITDKRLLDQRDRIRGVAYNPADKNKIILYGSVYMCQIDLQNVPVPKSLGKRKNSVAEEQPKDDFKIALSYQYQQILHCEFLKENHMVMIERPKFSVLEKLPPSYYKAQFGS
jgi:U3 small nucleolar RNA-associated protein 4